MTIEEKMIITDTSAHSQKSIQGIKWNLIIVVLYFPCVYILQLVLGKVSPEAVGAYSAFQVFAQLVTVFVILGGTQVFANFLPRMESDERKLGFLLSYTILILSLLMLFLTLVYFFPFIKAFLIKKGINESLFWFFPAYAFLFTLFFLIRSALNGLFEHKKAAFLERAQIFGLLVISLGFYFFSLDFIKLNFICILMISILLVNLIGSLLGGCFLIKRLVFSKPHFFLPERFWSFTLQVHLAVFFAFVFSNIDKIFILKIGSLGLLGYYHVALSLGRIPNVFCQPLMNVFVPLLAEKSVQNVQDLNSTFYQLSRYGILLNFLFILCLHIFGYTLLSFIGEDFAEYSSLLYIYLGGVSFTLCSVAIIPIIRVSYNNYIYVINGIFQIVLLPLLMIIGWHYFSVAGIVLAEAVWLAISQILPFYHIIRRTSFRIPNSYYLGVLLLLAFSCINLAISLSLPVKIIIGLFLFVIFLWIGHYRIEEIISDTKKLLLFG